MARPSSNSKRTKSSAKIQNEPDNFIATKSSTTKALTSKRTTADKTKKKADPDMKVEKSKKDLKNQQRQQSRIVTMQALQEMSDDDNDEDDNDGDLPPESEWNKEALALKAAIEAGTFDTAVLQNNNDDDEGSPFEEVDLDSDDNDDEQIDESGERDDLVDGDDDMSDDNDEGDDDEEVDDDGEGEDDIEEDEEVISDAKIESATDGIDKDDDVDIEDEEDDEDDEDENRALMESNATRAKALQVVTASLLAEKKNWDWSETLDVVPHTPLPFNKDVAKTTSGVSSLTATNPLGIHDDLQREVAFYDVALEAVLEAKLLCHKAGIPFTRPDDFFAEMVKTDGTLFMFTTSVQS